MPDDAFLQAMATRLRDEYPDAVAIVLQGSHARGEAGPYSDVDVTVLHQKPEARDYHSLLLPDETGRMRHVTVEPGPMDQWFAELRGESQLWAFYLPARMPARLLWATPEAEEQLKGRIECELVHAPQLQDFVDLAGKVRNARLRGDELGMRLAAHDLAWYAPSVLALVNDPVCPRTDLEALRAALDFPVAPPHYREDMLACLGFSGRAVDVADLFEAALRLARGVLQLLQPHAAELADRIEPRLGDYLADGRLIDYFEQA